MILSLFLEYIFFSAIIQFGNKTHSSFLVLANTCHFVFKNVAYVHVSLKQQSNKFHTQCKEPQQKHN